MGNLVIGWIWNVKEKDFKVNLKIFEANINIININRNDANQNLWGKISVVLNSLSSNSDSSCYRDLWGEKWDPSFLGKSKPKYQMNIFFIKAKVATMDGETEDINTLL